ncbi:hypothetical protein HN695_04460 [Candidatus Woesearchaeota archaeon]|jgi:hypothetical protein|nr:hypothetical protein [Candidatus Woesearchaeota archaeon]MBT5272402.1 hypothetical protein [Candidatus Woesearchaeota archaeon]MBT6041256.1 hypothetical protein [Candidatus Woesearchaeota archaeon]MBT6336674.1 hypothetical protein [Candidatus Woesearchaeota archaeon]MBT7927564.1 hypothetical protein [Candidatus Woesearchaeota archaeon]
MVNKQLVNYIKANLDKGISIDQLKNSLLNSGWTIYDVEVAAKEADYEIKHKSSIKKIFPYIMTLLIIFLMISATAWYFTKPICGDGKMSRGETSETCCIDAGCVGEQGCKENVCVDPICGECEYLENNRCKKYDCCESSDCDTTQECTNNECKELHCKFCEYSLDHKCNTFACCDDDDCDDNKENTDDACIGARTIAATCSNLALDECEVDSDCDDKDNSTDDFCLDSPKKCSNIKIKDCVSGDDFCPKKCSFEEDNDCEAEVIDCGIDFECFILAAETCELAKLNFITESTLVGAIQTTKSYLELKGYDIAEAEKCVLYLRLDDVSLRYSDDTLQLLLNSGVTLEEIDQQELEANQKLSSLKNKDGHCRMQHDELNEALGLWQTGMFLEYEFNAESCQGNYFTDSESEETTNDDGDNEELNNSVEINSSIDINESIEINETIEDLNITTENSTV